MNRGSASVPRRRLRSGGSKLASANPRPALRRGVPSRDLTLFTRLFATMVRAGIPLVSSLNALARQTQNERLRGALRDVVRGVESGDSLSDAMKRHPRIFPPVYANMVGAGEAGGTLDVVMSRLATYQEKSEALSRKLRGALVYPAAVVGAAVPAVAVALAFVVPAFEEMFASAGVALPLPTRVVIEGAHAVQQWWWAAAAAAIAAGLLAKRACGTDAGRLAADRLLLRLPLVGGLLRKAAVSRFARTLATLVASGVSILDGLEITAKTAGNRVVEDAVMKSRASIASGDTIAGPLEESGAFPPLVAQMVDAGERTGALDEMLARVADFYDQETSAAADAVATAAEPALILVLGVGIGGIIVAMYLPIFDMIGMVG